MKCPEGKILNPLSKKCVNEFGQTAKIVTKMLELGNLKLNRDCKNPDMIVNPISGRCVKINGEIGKKIIAFINLQASISVNKNEKTMILKKEPQIIVEKPIGFSKKNIDCLSRGKKELKLHQTNFVKAFMSHENKKKGAIAIHTVGSGKTLTAVTVLQCFLDKNPKSTVNILAPKSLISNFKNELYEYNESFKDDNRVNFFTYSSAARKMTNCKNSLLIIDEAHNLRNDKGARRKVFDKCADRASRVLLLTATPFVNSTSDLDSLLSIFTHKEDYDCTLSFFSPPPGELNEYYPKVTEINMFFKMDKRYLELYENVESDNLHIFEAKGLDIFTNKNLKIFYNGIRRATNNLEGIDGPKIKYITEIVKRGYDTVNDKHKYNNRFIIFSHWLDAGVKLVLKSLRQKNIKVGYIDGQTSIHHRNDVMKLYNSGSLNVVVISAAGSEGLNFFNTGYIIILDPGWHRAEMDQVIGRAVRYKGHFGSPLEKRNVKVIKMFLIKPTENPDKILNHVYENDSDRQMIKKKKKMIDSADLVLYKLQMKKTIEIEKFLEKIRKNQTLEECYD